MDKKYLFNTFYSASLDYQNRPSAETTVHLILVNVFLLHFWIFPFYLEYTWIELHFSENKLPNKIKSCRDKHTKVQTKDSGTVEHEHTPWRHILQERTRCEGKVSDNGGESTQKLKTLHSCPASYLWWLTESLSLEFPVEVSGSVCTFLCLRIRLTVQVPVCRMVLKF